MPEPRHGCHIGLIYEMLAADAYCYSTVGAWLHARATASTIELEFAVGHCASVKEVATMTGIFDCLNIDIHCVGIKLIQIISYV